MSFSQLSEWYYLIYLLPLGLSIFMIAASALGTAHRGGGPAHGGHGAVGHGHGHGAVGVSHAPGGAAPHAPGHGIFHHRVTVTDHSAHPPIGHSHAGHAHAEHEAHASESQEEEGSAAKAHATGGAHPILGFFGVGRVPSLLLAQGFALFWGASGFYATRMLASGEGATPGAFVLRAAEIAALSGVFGTKIIGEIGSRFMPSDESYDISSEDLIGSVGVAIFPVSATMGRVRVYDSFGTIHDESARLVPGEAGCIEKGESVLLVQCDEAGGFFLVEKSPV